MHVSKPLAALRRLRVQGMQRAGEAVVALHDPLGLADGGSELPVVVPQRIWEIARRFDGAADAVEIAARMRATHDAPSSAEIERVGAACSDKLLLDDARFRAVAAAALARWNELEERPCRDAALGSVDARMTLRIRIAGMVADDWDMPPPRGMHALFAPGGSLERAGRLYGRVYAAARHERAYERIVLLSSAGAPLDSLLVPLRRPLRTPLGVLRADPEGLAQLALAPDVSELAHARHLALERHALFLTLLLPHVPVLPLLVGALPSRLPDAQSSPRGLPEVEAALGALSRLGGDPRRTLVIACFELGHLDGRAEQPIPFSAHAGAQLRPLDRAAVDRALELNAEAFWREGMRFDDAWRAGQLVAPYLALRLLRERAAALPDGVALAGEVLGYVQSAGREDLSSWIAAAFLERELEPQ